MDLNNQIPPLSVSPIAYFQTSKERCLETASQGTLDPQSKGFIDLSSLPQWKDSLDGLQDFSHLWILFVFHRTHLDWKPKVWPPRSARKVGVFASRSPYRPNRIGMTAVKLQHIKGSQIHVCGHDLIDGTPILDIKPYLAYADAFPEAQQGWVDQTEEFNLQFSDHAKMQIQFLRQEGLPNFESALFQQLRFHPTDKKRKRVKISSPTPKGYIFSYRTWRVHFAVNFELREVYIEKVTSGYTPEEILLSADPYNDKDLHRRFILLTESYSPSIKRRINLKDDPNQLP